MADNNTRLIAALAGGVIGWWAGRTTVPNGTNYAGLGNLLGQVVPEVPVVPAAFYGRGYHGGHGHGGQFFDYDRDRRLAALEADAAANATAIRLNAQHDQTRMELAEARGDAKLYIATCHKVDGEVYLPPRRLGNGYCEASRVLDSHPVGRHGHGGHGGHCGNCGNWY